MSILPDGAAEGGVAATGSARLPAALPIAAVGPAGLETAGALPAASVLAAGGTGPVAACGDAVSMPELNCSGATALAGNVAAGTGCGGEAACGAVGTVAAPGADVASWDRGA